MRSAKVAPAPLPSEQENDVPNGTSEVAPSMVRPAIPAQDEAATAEQQATRLRLLFAEAVASELRAAGRKDTSGVRAGCTQLRATDSGHTLALGSAATILLCLRDSRTAPRFGELPALDELLARELRHGIGAYCEHLLGLAHRAAAAAAAAAAPASAPAAAPAAAAATALVVPLRMRPPLEPSLLPPTLASALALRGWLASLPFGDAVPADLLAAGAQLREAEAAVGRLLCSGYAALCSGCMRLELGGESWRAPRAWLGDRRCSYGPQLLALHLRGLASDLGAIGDAAAARRLRLRTLRTAVAPLLPPLWRLAPSRGRAALLRADLRFLLALLLEHRERTMEHTMEHTEHTEHTGGAAAADAGAVGGASPARAEAQAEVEAEAEAGRDERGMLELIALWLLSLLALHSAPLPQVCRLLRGMTTGAAAAEGAGASGAPAAAELLLERGGLELARPSAAADALLSSLRLAPLCVAPARAPLDPFDPVRELPPLSEAAAAAAAAATAASEDWAALFTPEAFPLRGSPRWLRDALRRHPKLREDDFLPLTEEEAAEAADLARALGDADEAGGRER